MSDPRRNRPEYDAGEILEGIRTWVFIESPTDNPEGVNRVMDLAEAEMARLGAAVERESGGEGYANLLTARVPGESEGPGILVLGHLDTVHAVTQRRVTPRDLGVTERTLDEVRGGSAEENADALRAVLRGDGSGSAALRDFIAVNTGAGLYVCGLAASIQQGAEQALTAIDEGEAAARLGAFVEATRRS